VAPSDEVNNALMLGQVVERLDNALEVQDEHGKLLNRIVGKLDDKEEVCARRHEEFLAGPVQKRVVAATGPVEVTRLWGKNPLVWAVLVLMSLMVGAVFEWQRYTYNLSNNNDKRLDVTERLMQQIPGQMQRQDAKIDKILDQVKKRNHGDNP
jgi:hypothetical protein